MRINPITPYYQNYQYKTSAKPAFSGFRPFETIKHLNLGMADVGIIGKVRVFDSAGHDKFLNVVKDTGVCGTEIYMLKTNYGEIIGEMIMRITKDPPPHKVARTGEPSWVWVDFLRNYSNPNTKYYREGLPEYKGIGTRLLQIAQRRSDETMCGGNLHLRSPFMNGWDLKKFRHYTNITKTRCIFRPMQKSRCQNSMAVCKNLETVGVEPTSKTDKNKSLRVYLLIFSISPGK